ncbi:MAG: 30S ribosomal protein S12 methylthiotransferase RimO [Clostridiales bacterium]|nr:30S ribosomal protein S12 methylthiotransferase RimO [Bacillota bacterium]NLL53772.1 30S ribosomal protein S12 methylthiotransferase RimO [Clostridiales bacterium]
MRLPKTVGVVSLGCSKNRVDSEVLLGQLRSMGVTPVADPARAELIVVNTCGFIEPAKKESIDTIFEMAAYKQRGRCRLLLVTGCLSQRYPEALFQEIPEADGFLGVACYDRLPTVLERLCKGERLVMTGEGERFFPAPRVLTTPPYSAYVKISDGCDNRCTYCAIPLIRGAYRSRDYGDILQECGELVRGGVSEITLIAQDTSRYGNDLSGGKLLLPDLLRDVSNLEGLHWLRVLYCYPDTVDERLLDTLVSLPKAARYLDLPLQHINGTLLKRMNRRGSPEHIRKLIKLCRERGILVRTTMILGFPGESDAMFNELLDFIREARFDRLGAFTFSPEEGTSAADMPGQLPEEVKQMRLDQVMMTQQGISLEHNEGRIGETCEVLVEGFEGGSYFGRSLLEAPEVDGLIRFDARSGLKAGQYVFVRITGADAYDLFGEAIG